MVIGVSGGLVFGNAAWRELSGFDSGAPWDWASIVAEDERDRVCREVEHALTEHRVAEIEFHARRAAASARTLMIVLGPLVENSEFVGLFGVSLDVSEPRRREQRLAFMAGHDPLTGLANRRAFQEALERASSLSERDVPSVLVMLDMDHLKRYNDARGHLEGDQALVNLALMLRSHIRASDLAARIGGDEFALLLSGASISEADEIVDRICASALGEFVVGAFEAELGVSGGIAAVEPGVDSRVVMNRADSALYAAKHGGRHCFVKWNDTLGGIDSCDWLARQVRDAFADDGLSLVFQPIVRLSDGHVAYYESLVRMRGAAARPLLPGEFLPEVERLGLMSRLAVRVLELAIQALEANPGAAVSVNVSAGDIADSLLLDDVAFAVQSAGIEPGRLVFEIAEECLLANLAEGTRWMERLAPLGCRFVLDEFGSGLGVFVLLGVEHIEQVKLSRALMEALADSRESRQFVHAVRELIQSQGKLAVAAFIETETMLDEIIEAGFDYSQGNCLHEPAADLGSLITEMGASKG